MAGIIHRSTAVGSGVSSRNPAEGDVVVVGAGVIGLTISVMLQRSGYRVVLVDRGAPGAGCSSGNAAVLATSFILPLSSPRHILMAPGMLLNARGPLAIRSRDLVALAPWLARFALNALPARQQRTITALKAINALALPAWKRFLTQIGQSDMLVERGMLEVAARGDRAAARSLAAHAERLSAEGVALEWLDAATVGELEPALSQRVEAGVLHSDVAHVRDPEALNDMLLMAFLNLGGEVRRLRVDRITPAPDRVAVSGEGHEQCFSHAVIAAGYWSAALLKPMGLCVPLGVERGYHHMVREAAHTVTRPVAFHAESFLATPLDSGLRLAGTVELARAEAAPDWRRADLLPQLAQRYLPDINPEGGQKWMGHRPSFPDGLPAVGKLPDAPRLLYAFGHQHLGLTQAAATADAISALIGGGATEFPLGSTSLARF